MWLSKNIGWRGRLLVWHRCRSLPRCFQGMEAGAVPLPCASLPIGIFQLGDYTLVLCLHFYSCCQGTSLYHLTLVTQRAYAPGSRGTVTNRARALKWLPPQGTVRGPRLQSSIFLSERPINLSSGLQPEGQTSN